MLKPWFTLAAASSLCFTAMAAVPFMFTNVEFPAAQIAAPISGAANCATGINNAGQIVGIYDDASGRHGFLRTGGIYSTVDAPTALTKGTSTTASAINDSGQIVGWYGACDTCTSRGFLFSGGVFTDIIHPAAGAGGVTIPSGINNAGQIVGYYIVPSGGSHGFLLRGGVFTSFDFPGATNTAAVGINNAGQIVGYYNNGNSTSAHAFVLNGGSFTSIADFPGSQSTRALSINDLGQIVGDYVEPASPYFHGFFFSGGTFTSVDFPGAVNNEVSGVNNDGQIVGLYAGGTHGFTAQVPASSSMAQLASGGGWTTTITLINTDTSAAQVVLNFFDDNGSPLQLPLTFPQGSSSPVTTATLTRTVNAGAELVIQSTGPASQSTQVGWAQLLTPNGNVSGFALFAAPSGNSLQEAVVPLENRTPGAFVLSFDNTSDCVTGVALANVDTKSASVGIVVRDDTGVVLLTNSITLPAQGHTSFALATNYPVTSQRRGTVEFDMPANGRISVLGLRFNRTGAFSSIPAVAK